MKSQEDLFQEIYSIAQPNLPASVTPKAGKGNGGASHLQLEDTRWCDEQRGVQIHIELTTSNKIALHVETYPYQSSKTAALENKNLLLEKVRNNISSLQFPAFEVKPPRKGWEGNHSSTVGFVNIDPNDTVRSAETLAAFYRAVTPFADAQLELN